MRLVILECANAVSEWAAKYVMNRINEFNAGPDKYFVLGLPTGKSSFYIYELFLIIENKFPHCFVFGMTLLILITMMCHEMF